MRRLDEELVHRKLADSRARAKALIKAGVVEVDGQLASKPAMSMTESNDIRLTEDPIPFVSRAALKLDHALKEFDLSPSGAVALDLGASTGGFTEVLLQAGARRVYALDVGHGQLHPSIATDARVVSIENTNCRLIPDGMIPPVDWITCDLSFISLEKALPRPLELAKPGAVLVALVKPQFEVGREAVGKGGIVRDSAAHEAVRNNVEAFLETQGWRVTHRGDSPIEGADGNREFLVAAVKELSGG